MMQPFFELDPVMTGILGHVGSGATAVVSGIVSVFSSLVANEAVITLVGLFIGYKICKMVIGFIPMFQK